jgi:hypothetical protein
MKDEHVALEVYITSGLEVCTVTADTLDRI